MLIAISDYSGIFIVFHRSVVIFISVLKIVQDGGQILHRRVGMLRIGFFRQLQGFCSGNCSHFTKLNAYDILPIIPGI